MSDKLIIVAYVALIFGVLVGLDRLFDWLEKRQPRRTPAIRTSHECPPIPVRSMDWAAWTDGNEEGPIGRGATEAEAVADLQEQLEERQ